MVKDPPRTGITSIGAILLTETPPLVTTNALKTFREDRMTNLTRSHDVQTTNGTQQVRSQIGTINKGHLLLARLHLRPSNGGIQLLKVSSLHVVTHLESHCKAETRESRRRGRDYEIDPRDDDRIRRARRS